MKLNETVITVEGKISAVLLASLSAVLESNNVRKSGIERSAVVNEPKQETIVRLSQLFCKCSKRLKNERKHGKKKE